MTRTVIFLSTTTSATGSMWRAIHAIAGERYTPLRQDRIFGRTSQADYEKIKTWIPPERDHVILFNAPRRINRSVDLSKYGFIVNTRDPRDLVCNKYSWVFTHPLPDDTPNHVQTRHETARKLGIDRWALESNFGTDYDEIEATVENLPPENWTFVGYALYCLHFDDAVKKIADMLAVDLATLPPGQRKRLEAERTENLAANARWIGQRWEGADTAPGRHRRELRPETIHELNKRYAKSLTFLRRVDDPRLRHLYD